MSRSASPQPLSRAVLFDLDGVLLDTEPLYTEATQAVVAEFGKRFDWSLKRELIGTSEDNGARLVVERLGLPISPSEYLARRKPLLDAAFQRCAPMPGIEALIDELLGHRVPVAVATSSMTALYAAKTARHPWFERFTAVICGDDPRVRSVKPAPDIFLAAAESVGVEPGECVVIEDSPAGIQAGLAAGMRVVAAPDPNLADEHVSAAHQIVRDGAALRSVLLGWLAL